jgi:tRNA modification GTPase
MATVQSAALVVVRTKSDLAGDTVHAEHEVDALEVHASAVSGAGLGELRDVLVGQTFSGSLVLGAGAPLITRERHARDLRRARSEVAAFLDARASELAPEIAATHLRSASQALEEMLGVIAPEELLARVFSDFCIGK